MALQTRGTVEALAEVSVGVTGTILTVTGAGGTITPKRPSLFKRHFTKHINHYKKKKKKKKTTTKKQPALSPRH